MRLLAVLVKMTEHFFELINSYPIQMKFVIFPGDSLAPRWWLPTCFRSKVDEIKTYMNRLVDIFSICRFCFSIDIVRRMAALSDCLRQDDPLHALKTLALAIESAETTTHIANAMTEVAGQINTTTGDCEERGKITTLVEHINFYANGIENGFFTCNGNI